MRGEFSPQSFDTFGKTFIKIFSIEIHSQNFVLAIIGLLVFASITESAGRFRGESQCC